MSGVAGKNPIAAFAFAAIRLVVAAALAFATSAHAQSGDRLERQVKAAFLYRFVDYVRWPETAFTASDSPFVIGVLADPALLAEVQAVTAGRNMRGRPVVAREAREGDLGGLHVLFVAGSASPRLQRLIRSAHGPVLIVTEAEDGLAHGSIINFVLADQRVRFEVALRPASERQLSIGSGLLSVAINVRKGSRLWSLPHTVLALLGTSDKLKDKDYRKIAASL